MKLLKLSENEGEKVSEYIYRGDRQTSEFLRGEKCSAVRRHDGKCIRGKNGSMLVTFNGKNTVVIGRQLRKNSIGDKKQKTKDK